MSTDREDSCQARFRSERTRLGFTHEQTGALCGASRRTVIDWEATTSPSADKLRELARFGFDVQYVVIGVRSSAATRVADAAGGLSAPVLGPEEWKAIKRFRTLGEAQRAQALAMLEVLALGGSTSGTTVIARGKGTKAAGHAIYETGRRPPKERK